MLTIEADFFRGVEELDDEDKHFWNEISPITLMDQVWENLSFKPKDDSEATTLMMGARYARANRHLLMYWKSKLDINGYSQIRPGFPMPVAHMVSESETLAVQEWYSRGPQDVLRYLDMKIVVPNGKFFFRLSEVEKDGKWVYDELEHQPTIEANIKSDPDESPDKKYTFKFDRNWYVPDSPFVLSEIHGEVRGTDENLLESDERTIRFRVNKLPVMAQ